MKFLPNFSKFKTSRNQYISVLCANLMTLAHGCAVGWTSPFIPVYLSKEKSPLESGAITIYEASWLGAFLCIGAIIGNLLFGWLSNNFGRKMALILTAFPNFISWILIIYATNVYYLYVARILAGITDGGVFVAVSLFVADVSQSDIRGFLGSILTVANNLGILVSFIIGTFIGPILTSKIIVFLPVIFLILMLLMHESAQHLLKRNQIDKAEKSLSFYRNFDKNSASETDKQIFNEEFELLKLNSKDVSNSEDAASFMELFKPEALKGLSISIVLIIMSPLCGCFPLITYTSIAFSLSGSTIDPNIQSIVVAFTQFIGAYLSTILVDRSGRKKLLIISTIGNIIGLTIMGVFSYLSLQKFDLSSYHFIPTVGLCFAIFMSSIGILPVPMVIIAEVVPNKIRSIGTAICVASFNLGSLISVKVFPILLLIIELYGCLAIFIFFSVVGLLFIIIVVPETKGKNLESTVEITKL